MKRTILLALALALVVVGCGVETATPLVTAPPTRTPEPTLATSSPPTALRMLLVTVNNQSGRPATLKIGWDGMFDGRETGTVNPSVLPPGITESVVLGVPPLSGWAIYVNPGPDWGASITWRDIPADASGQMPFSIVVVEEGWGAADAAPPGWFGTPTEAPSEGPPEVTATPQPTPVPVPPKPTGVTFEQQVLQSDDGQVATITQTVRWRAPRSEGVEIRVYGVTECIAEPADPSPGTSGPCLVVHTPLPASVRTLLATAPASDGVTSSTWTEAGHECGEPLVFFDPDGPVYHAVVLAAYGPSGHSIFAIAEPGGWWRAAVGDIVC